MLEDARTTVILTQAHLAADIPPSAATVICVDRDWPEISKESPENPQSGVKPENAAYVIFTSGSTGRPKGVLNEHRGIVNRLLWMQDEYGLTAKDAVLQKTTFSFDVSVWEFFWPLLVGSRLVVARPGGHRDSAYLVNTINEKDITTIHFVPSMLQLFLEDRNIGSCKGLKRVICSGEALPYELQERFFHSLDSELHNLYGPTEAAVDVTYWPCRRHSEVRSVPIGRPVANTQIYILDRRMRPVPVGVPGELHIGGIQVARGYVNRPDLTAEKFIPDPFSAEPGAHLYKTGDLCKFLPDGAIDYLGRLDFQVKIRGLRIEIGEIESVLSQHPDVREVVVVAREDTPGAKRLVAYFVSSKSSNVNIDDLRTFLKGKLADYMVPSAFLQMEAFPLTSSGKADRKALPAPAGMRQIETAFVAPQSEAENAIAEIWKEYLKLDAVGVHDNFFDLGGHSLLLVRIMNRLQQVFGRTMTVVDMFQHPTIQGLAEFVTADSQEAPEAGIIRDRAAKQKEALKRQKRLRRDSDCIQ
jgi:amino acid adenylation domain-containing protein